MSNQFDSIRFDLDLDSIEPCGRTENAKKKCVCVFSPPLASGRIWLHRCLLPIVSALLKEGENTMARLPKLFAFAHKPGIPQRSS